MRMRSGGHPTSGAGHRGQPEDAASPRPPSCWRPPLDCSSTSMSRPRISGPRTRWTWSRRSSRRHDIPKGMSGATALVGRPDRRRAGAARLGAPVRGHRHLAALRARSRPSTISAQAVHHRRRASSRRPRAAAARSPRRSATRDKVAVTISVDAERGVANQIAPGDRVDILVVNEGSAGLHPATTSRCSPSARRPRPTRPAANGQPSATAAKSGLITFELSSADAAQVVAANRSGTLYLTLKPISGGSSGDTSVAASGR